MIILIAFDYFGKGAVSRVARQMAEALLDAGYEIVAITDRVDGPYQDFRERYPGRFKAVSLGSLIIKGPFHDLIRELDFAFKCRKCLVDLARQYPVDMVISHASTACYAVASFTKHKRIPGIFVIHGLIWDIIGGHKSPYKYLTTLMYQHSNSYALSHMRYCVAISNYIMTSAISRGAYPENVFTIHNPVDLRIFSGINKAKKEINVLFIGRLSPEKGVHLLLEAAQTFSKEIKIVVIGEGPYRKYLEKKAKQIPCTVSFLGWVKHEELVQYQRRAKIQVVPSLWMEAQGCVVIEAMACGVPVVGSRVGGIPEMIQHGLNGWLVPPNDVQSLSSVIKDALSDQDSLEVISRAAARTAEAFSFDRYKKQVVVLCSRIIKDHDKRTH